MARLAAEASGRPMDCESNDPKSKETKQMEKGIINQIKPIKRLSSVKELAAAFGTTEWYWRKKIRDGGLPYVRVGRKIFVDSQDIDNFIQQ